MRWFVELDHLLNLPLLTPQLTQPPGIFPMLKLFQAGDGKSITFAILYIVNVVIW